MIPWSLAVGNLSRAAPTPPPHRAPPTPRRDRAPWGLCDCCGQPLPNPAARKPWTPDEDAVLIEMFAAEAPYRAIASRLSRGLSSIHSRIATLGLRP